MRDQCLAVFVDGAESVRVAVEGDSEVGFVGEDRVLEVLQICGNCGVGMMIGEAAVHIEEQLGCVAV